MQSYENNGEIASSEEVAPAIDLTIMSYMMTEYLSVQQNLKKLLIFWNQ